MNIYLTNKFQNQKWKLYMQAAKPIQESDYLALMKSILLEYYFH